jgi:hypothetical protein
MKLSDVDPLAVAVVDAIHGGDVASLRQLLADHPALATGRIVDAKNGARSLLHIVTDWPGHKPRSGLHQSRR